MQKRFTTISGIKREAKKRSRVSTASHMNALDEVSREDGYSNFKEARAKLSTPILREIQFWQNYRDEHDTHKGGLVEGSVFVRRPPSFYLNSKTRKAMWFGLQKTRMQDIYRLNFTCTGKDAAEIYVGNMLRTIQFSDITGYLPSTKRSLETMHGYERPPWGDHGRVWEHFETGDVLYSEEPYPSRLERKGTEKENWARSHGLELSLNRWGSVYSPHTEMILMTPFGSHISLSETLDKLGEADKAILP